jgi:colanic acid/amylovoran biosynthesis protein
MLEAAGPFDAFVDISGFAYGDTWGAGPALSVLPLVRRAREHLLPVVFLPQAWGGFSRPRVRDAVLALTGGERTLVFSRDPRSTSHLEAAGVQPGAIATRSDVVFAFEGGTQERGAELLAVMGCRPERPIVAVTPNMRIYERSRGEGAENAYVQTLVALVRHCVDEHDAEVALLPFECAPVDRGTDDRRLCAMVRSEARRDEACHTSSAYISAADARAMTGRCEYMIGSRYHSLVFALSQGVPCTALSWSHKYAQLMELFGVPEDCVGHNQARDTADLVDAFEAGWARREVQRRHNLSVAAVLRADAHAVFDVTARFLLARGLP